MNKKFTKLTAALALLTFLAVPLGMWGQTRADQTAKWTATSGGLGTGIGSGTITDNGNFSWSYTRTLISGTSYTGWTSNCIQLGKNGGVENLTLTTSAIPGIIKSVAVECSSYNAAHKVSITVGEVTYLASTATSSWTTVGTATGTGTSSGTITIAFTGGTRALYIKSITVVYDNSGGPTTYTVTYNGNGNTSGGVPVDDTEYDDDNNTVTVLGPGDLAKTGHTFEWWSDMEDGTDEDANLYVEDDTFEITENTTLYAQWSVNTYNYTLNVTGDDGEAMAELQVDGSTVAQDAKIAYDKEVTVVVATNTGYNYSIEVKDADNNDIPVANDKFTMPASDVTVSVTTTSIPTYTITFDAGSGTCNTSTTSGYDGSTITLPTATPSQACASRGWTFAGWATTSVSETTNAPTLLNGDYTITADADLYAVYKVTEGEGGTTEFNFAEIAAANDWENSVAYTEVTIAPVTIEAQGGGNNGKWYTNNGGSWRMYSGGTVEISVTSNNVTAVTSTPSCDFTINNGTASYSPSARTDFTNITVTYGTSTTTYNSNPSCLEIVATPTFTVAAGTYTGAQTVEINCGTTGAGIYYTLDGSEPTNQSTPYNGAISIATSTTLKAIATNDGMDDSEIATAEYVIQYILTVSKDHVGFGLYDYYVDEDEQEHWDDIDVNEQTGTALVRSGANVRISVEDVDDCYLLQGFNVVDGDNNPVQVDNLMEEDGTYSFIMPASNATLAVSTTAIPTHTLTVATLNHVTLELTAGEESNEVQSGEELCEGIHVTVVATPDEGYVMGTVSVVYGNNQSVEVTTEGSDTYSFYMPTDDATINVTVEEYVAPLGGTITFGSAEGSTKIEGASSSGTGTVTYTDTGNDSNGNVWTITTVTSKNKSFTQNASYSQVGSSSNPVNSITFTTTFSEPVIITDFQTKFGGYSNTAGNITLKVGETTVGTGSLNGTNDVVVSNTLVASGTTLTVTVTNIERGVKCYYISYEYLKPLHIDGYNGGDGGWYLIASPVTELTPSAANGFITDTYGSNIPDGETGTYDLYYFDQTGGDNGKEWKNYRQHTFNLESGKGYLYASKEGTDLIFTGTAYNGNGVVNLTYSESTSIDDNMRGWNLIGNPFGTTANLPSGLSYYTLNESRTELTPGSATTIGAMKAIFVQATATGQSVTFTKQTRNAGSNAILSLNLSNDSNGLIDRTIVRFDEGNALPKFMLNPNNTKVFIPVESKDYAVVRHEAQGEMPVNFKAAENGTYTLTVNPEGVEMNYLHLIDNMTGADIDLLAATSTGSVATYTFNASTTDYSSRFRLVFAANNEDGPSTGSGTFAFYSNGNWIINNAGEATLQVVDVNGRILSSETVNGSVSKAINAPAGVYMLRLINGNDVKTQKIVVR